MDYFGQGCSFLIKIVVKFRKVCYVMLQVLNWRKKMLLKELIDILERCELSKTVEGFGNPHSYRGYYEELAFEPMTTTIQDMLEAATSADGECYRGYKGGEFTMDGNTEVHIAYYGCCGSPLTKALLAEMVW